MRHGTSSQQATSYSPDLQAPATTRFWLLRDRDAADRWCRVDQPARALGARVCLLGRDDLDDEHADGGVAVFRFPRLDVELRAMRRARELGARVLLDCDDYPFGERMARLLALNAVPIDHSRATLKRELERTRLIQACCVSALRFADAVTVASRALAGAYRRHARALYVVPNQIDPDDWPPSFCDLGAPAPEDERESSAEAEKLKRRGADAPSRDDVFRVGFAGSTSHANDLHLMRDALAWASEQDGVEVVFAGWHPRDAMPEREHEAIDELIVEAHDLDAHDPAKTRLYERAQAIAAQHAERWSFPISVIPWTNRIETHARNLTRFDLGLCPADDDAPFTPYRSDLKPLEYAMAGALPIVSRSRCYAEWWDRVPTAADAHEFRRLVAWAIANRDEVRERAFELREHVLSERTIEANLWRWRQALDGSTMPATTP